jgi:hypothetical protein
MSVVNERPLTVPQAPKLHTSERALLKDDINMNIEG